MGSELEKEEKTSEEKPILPGKQSRPKRKRNNDNGVPLHRVGAKEKYTPYMLGKLATQYFESCDKTVIAENEKTGLKTYKPKLKSGLAKFLKVSLPYFSNHREKEGYEEVIEMIDGETLADVEEGTLVGRYNPSAGIFHLKNHYSQTDKTEIKSDVDNKITIRFE